MKKSYKDLETELSNAKQELIATRQELVATRQELVVTRQELVVTRQELFKTKDLLKLSFNQIMQLQKEISDLKQKLNKNSKNSSKPPSTDQKSNTQDRGQKKRESREGKNRPLFLKEEIDKIVECNCEKCPCCGSQNIEALSTNEILQQIDLPEIKAIITEYILRRYQCSSCGKSFKSDLPKGIPNSVFGTKLMGLISNLTGLYHLAKREVIQLIKDLYGIDIGLGSISNIEERVANALESVYQKIHDFIINSNFTKHFDETGWRNKGKKHYVWVATCTEAAIYKIDRNRNKIAFQKLIKNQDLTDKSFVSDRYSVYNNISKNHQYCLAHLIREFKNFSQRDGPDKKIGELLEKALKKACFVNTKYRKGKIILANRNRQLGKIKRKVKSLFKDGYANGSDELSGLCKRLLKSFDNLWVFTKISDMEPTNNLAERDLRKIVIWRKKSYGTRSEKGKRFIERISSISQTLRKQGKNVLKFIQSTIKNFYSNKAPELINPEMNF